MGFCSQNYCRRLCWLYLEGHIHLCSALLPGSGLLRSLLALLGETQAPYWLYSLSHPLQDTFASMATRWPLLLYFDCFELCSQRPWRSGGQVSWEPMWMMSFICSKCFTHAGRRWRKRAGRNRENQPACLEMLGEAAEQRLGSQ